MKNLTKTLFAAVTVTAMSAPAFAQTSAPDTSPVCAPISATVYFAEGDTSLSNAAKLALQAEATDIGGCTITEVAATAISTDGDSTLSQARSAAVLAELANLGVTTTDAATSIGAAPEGRFLSTNRQVQLTMTTIPSTISS